MDNGNLLIAGSNTETIDTVEDFIYEIDSITGEIVNTLDLKEVFQRMRRGYTPVGIEFLGAEDWFHLNSIDYCAEDDSIIVSGNFQSTIAKIDWPTGEIIWMISEEEGWTTRFEEYILTPIGDNFEYTYNQHAVEILPDYDNNPDTIDIIAFDNGASRSVQNEELGLDSSDLYSRLVKYRINEVTMEVEQIWEYGKDEAMEVYSRIMGDADPLENGNILGTFPKHQSVTDDADMAGAPVIREVTTDGSVVWETEIFSLTGNGDIYVYASDKVDLYRNTTEISF